MASTCSVTFIEPISAVIPAPPPPAWASPPLSLSPIALIMTYQEGASARVASRVLPVPGPRRIEDRREIAEPRRPAQLGPEPGRGGDQGGRIPRASRRRLERDR